MRRRERFRPAAAAGLRPARCHGTSLLAAAEELFDRPRGTLLRVPAQAQDGDAHAAAAEGQRVVAAPHVEIDLAALHLGTGVHHRPDAAVLFDWRIDADHAADRQQRRIGGGHAGPYRRAGRGRGAFAVGRRVEAEGGAEPRAPLGVDQILLRRVAHRRGEGEHDQQRRRRHRHGAPSEGPDHGAVQVGTACEVDEAVGQRKRRRRRGAGRRHAPW